MQSNPDTTDNMLTYCSGEQQTAYPPLLQIKKGYTDVQSFKTNDAFLEFHYFLYNQILSTILSTVIDKLVLGKTKYRDRNEYRDVRVF